MFKKIKIKLTPTSKEEKEIFFDPDVFSLLDDQTKQIEERLQKKIAVALMTYHHRDLPLYISRIMRRTDGHYDVLVLYATHDVEKFIIDLATASEIKAEVSKQDEFSSKQIDPTQVDYKFGETSFLPPEFNLQADANQSIATILKTRYISDFEKEKQKEIEYFVQGISYKPCGVEPEPVISKPINEKNYTFNKALEVFKPLEKFAELVDDGKQLEDNFLKVLEKFNGILREAGKIDNKLLDYAIQESRYLDLEDLLVKINGKQSIINRMLEEATPFLAPIYANHVNVQDNLNYFKKCLAWSLHYAAGKYFNILQKQTERDGFNRQKKIENFNKHFKDLLQINPDGSLSDITLVYENFSKLSLTQIAALLNNLLACECNTTTGWSSDKQKELVKGINEGASIIGLIDEPPFEAWEKYILGFGKAGFRWNKKLLSDEQKAAHDVTLVKQGLESDEKFTPLKTLSLTVEKNLLEALSKNFAEFQAKIDNQKKLLDLQKQAVDIKNQANEAFSIIENQPENWLTNTQQAISQMLSEIASCSSEEHSFIVDNVKQKTSAFNFENYVAEQCVEINKKLTKINQLEENATKIKSIDDACVLNPLLEIEKKVRFMRTHAKHALGIKLALEHLTNQIKIVHSTVVHNDKIKKLKAFQNELSQVSFEMGSNYNLVKPDDIANQSEILALLEEYEKSRNIIESFHKQYQQLIDVEDENFLKNLSEAKGAVGVHFENVKLCFDKIKGLLRLAKEKPQPVPSEVPSGASSEIKIEPDVVIDINPDRHRDNQERENGDPPPHGEPEIRVEAPASQPVARDGFFKQHWGKMLVGGLVFSGLAVAGVFTAGAVPLIAGIAGGLSGAATLGATAAAGGLLGVATGASVGAIAGAPPEGGIKGFFKRNWKNLLLGAGVGVGVAGIAVATVFTLGIAGVAFAGIGAATAASASALGFSLTPTLAGILGCSLIGAGSTVAGATLAGYAGSIAEGEHFSGRSPAESHSKPKNGPVFSPDNDDHDHDRDDHEPDLSLRRGNAANTREFPRENTGGFNNNDINHALSRGRSTGESEEDLKKQIDEMLQQFKEIEQDKDQNVNVKTLSDYVDSPQQFSRSTHSFQHRNVQPMPSEYLPQGTVKKTVNSSVKP